MVPAAARSSEPSGGASVATGSVARFAAELLGAAFALLTGSVTARHLGPGRKGILSAVGYLVALFGTAGAWGMGDAAVTLIRSGASRAQEAVSATIAALFFTSILAAGGSVLVGIWQIHPFGTYAGTFAATAMATPLMAASLVLVPLVEAQQRLVAAAAGRLIMAASTLIATVVFVIVLNRAVQGGVLALAAGSAVGSLYLVAILVRTGVAPLPRWNHRYLIRALPLGGRMQVAFLLVAGAARLDVLIVHGVSGSYSTGEYSVAVTVGLLSAYGAIALSAASYPRVAGLPADEVRNMTERLFRMALTSALVLTVGLVIVNPVLIPIAFGQGFRPAVAPAAVLACGGIIWSGQWVLGRAGAARGSTGTLIISFVGSLLSMVAMDFALIPPMGVMGAAVASLLSNVVGLVLALVVYQRTVVPLTLAGLLPRRDDLSYLRALFQSRP